MGGGAFIGGAESASFCCGAALIPGGGALTPGLVTCTGGAFMGTSELRAAGGALHGASLDFSPNPGGGGFTPALISHDGGGDFAGKPGGALKGAGDALTSASDDGGPSTGRGGGPGLLSSDRGGGGLLAGGPPPPVPESRLHSASLGGGTRTDNGGALAGAGAGIGASDHFSSFPSVCCGGAVRIGASGWASGGTGDAAGGGAWAGGSLPGTLSPVRVSTC
mmetsp:Transcript_96741/g.167931  ORF Transcript_96741/g.167931 Transcript_96741/m.167931 type:complete len:221 (+) Transcript_96741:714-1376(+)